MLNDSFSGGTCRLTELIFISAKGNSQGLRFKIFKVLKSVGLYSHFNHHENDSGVCCTCSLLKRMYDIIQGI